MPQRAKGVLAMIAACAIWGLVPVFYKALAIVPPVEVLAHRTIWSFVLFSLLLGVQGRFGEMLGALGERRIAPLVGLAGVLIATNWFTFILAVQIGLTVEASLGYYIFPLVAVVLGFVVFGERLTRWQVLAVLLAASGVVVLTLGLGAAPKIALVLSLSFGCYGLLKKKIALGSVVSVTGEVALLAPLAVVWLLGVHFGGWTGVVERPGAWFGRDFVITVLLILSGAITAGPLILFSYAARRLRLATVGLIQYLNPSLQFLVAVLLFRESFTIWHGVCFGLIWVALAIYSFAAFRAEKSAASAPSSASTEATAVK